MSSKLKVEFIDNSSSQYDANADLIKIDSIKSKGKLYLGDRYAASYIQLKFRNCKSVINCCTETHGLAKETDVKYLKIDPEASDNLDCFSDAYDFIEKELNAGKNVVVHCDNGFGKSGLILLYYIMKKKSMDLAESYRYLKKYRTELKIRPSLISIIIKMEKSLRGSVSVMIDSNRKLVFLDELGLNRKKTTTKQSNQSNTIYYVIFGVGIFFAVLFGAIYLITGKI